MKDKHSIEVVLMTGENFYIKMWQVPNVGDTVDYHKQPVFCVTSRHVTAYPTDEDDIWTLKGIRA